MQNPDTEAVKPYETPTLQIHGSVEEITERTGGQDIDGLGGSNFPA
jgi:hypothetical protein